jgi:hypothetical protein
VVCRGLDWPSFRVSAQAPEVLDGHHDPSVALDPTTPVFTNTERLVLAGFLAGYSGLARQAYELRQFAGWCRPSGRAPAQIAPSRQETVDSARRGPGHNWAGAAPPRRRERRP